ncbi:MAG: TraR/DksA family transcriptional regulator [Patescibacteria group bacterium]
MDEIVQLTSVDPFTDPEHVVDNAAVDSDVREQNQHMLIEAEVKELKRRLDDIIIALEKIEKGTYGVCEKTNQPIPESRLALIPEARFVVSPEQ